MSIYITVLYHYERGVKLFLPLGRSQSGLLRFEESKNNEIENEPFIS